MVLSSTCERSLRAFLCEHFDALELSHLARGVFSTSSDLHHKLPPASASREELVDKFVDVAIRHGYIDDGFFTALCAARPRLCDKIRQLLSSLVATVPAEPAIQHGRVRLRLEVELEALSPEAIAEILAVLRKASGDSKMTIESISRGSSVLIVRGNAEAVERLASEWRGGGIDTVGGHTISSVEVVPAEQVMAPIHQQNATDVELLKRWQAGDRTAGEALTRRHYADLQQFVRRKLEDSQAIVEIVQDTFMNLIADRHTIREGTNFRAFLTAIAVRLVYKWLRVRSVAAEVDSEMMRLTQAGTDSDSLKNETNLIYRALRELPAEEQLAIELFNWEECSAPDIAELTGSTVAVVKHRIRRGHEMLKALVLRFQSEPGASAVDTEELEQWFKALRQRAAMLARH